MRSIVSLPYLSYLYLFHPPWVGCRRSVCVNGGLDHISILESWTSREDDVRDCAPRTTFASCPGAVSRFALDQWSRFVPCARPIPDLLASRAQCVTFACCPGAALRFAPDRWSHCVSSRDYVRRPTVVWWLFAVMACCFRQASHVCPRVLLLLSCASFRRIVAKINCSVEASFLEKVHTSVEAAFKEDFKGRARPEPCISIGASAGLLLPSSCGACTRLPGCPLGDVVLARHFVAPIGHRQWL